MSAFNQVPSHWGHSEAVTLNTFEAVGLFLSQALVSSVLVYMYGKYYLELLEPDIDIGEYAIQTFSCGNTGPQWRMAHMGPDHKTDAIFLFVLWSIFETKVKAFFKNENKFF